MPPVRAFVNSQLCAKLPIPAHSFANQTIIVTGSNIGMGLEAARHFVRLSAAKVILAVRTISKGLTAKASIEDSTGRQGVVEVWELDQSSYASVQAFAEKAKALERLDILVLNAGMYVFEFKKVEEDEETITVNVVSTMLLALTLLPKLRETAAKTGGKSVLTFTGSFVHKDTSFPERKAPNIFEGLAKAKGARMSDRYNVSKLIETFCVRELADKITESKSEGKVVANILNPGFVDTAIMRNSSFLFSIYVLTMKKLLSRTTEEGGRTLVHGAEGGDETHGQYLDDCKVGRYSGFVLSEEGMETQKRLWSELSEKLERIQPGIM
ncbi:related to enoyl-CoA hydratase/isomerase [Phialocephala subalpina]|uniref:Related to enoyl-CoA hydratase/isomerase n=1 Tax=Phialocephala subalpina TaxID=576137 RepID=A0A1L7XP64_9HELO|nr:related to enoyl-CoA hydratase/isomerase [Phialocephala subalpina]